MAQINHIYIRLYSSETIEYIKKYILDIDFVESIFKLYEPGTDQELDNLFIDTVELFVINEAQYDFYPIEDFRSKWEYLKNFVNNKNDERENLSHTDLIKALFFCLHIVPSILQNKIEDKDYANELNEMNYNTVCLLVENTGSLSLNIKGYMKDDVFTGYSNILNEIKDFGVYEFLKCFS